MAGSQSHLPSLRELVAWLDDIAAAHRARMSASNIQSLDQQAIANDLRFLHSLLLGQAIDTPALQAIRLIIAQGILNWRFPQQGSVMETTIQSLVCSAIWPLIIIHNLPTGWEDALQEITSPEITLLGISLVL